MDRYTNWLTALTLTYKPVKNVRLRLISAVFQASEPETYDISGEYWLGKLEAYQGSSQGQVTEVMGVGAYLDHARNYLDGSVFNIEHRGSWDRDNSNLLWVIKYEHEFFNYKSSEWELQDSAGYSLPHPQDSIGSQFPPKTDLVLYNVIFILPLLFARFRLFEGPEPPAMPCLPSIRGTRPRRWRRR